MRWAMLVRTHAELVWRTTRRLLDDVDAADAFQVTFLAAWRLSNVRPVRDWPALLQHLATARAIDRLRRRQTRARRDAGEGALRAAPDRSPGPLDRLQAAELAERLRSALAALPPRRCEINCPRHLIDMSFEQIATEMGLSAGAVAVHLHRGTRKLRRALRPLVAEESDLRRWTMSDAAPHPDRLAVATTALRDEAQAAVAAAPIDCGGFPLIRQQVVHRGADGAERAHHANATCRVVLGSADLTIRAVWPRIGR